MVAAQTALFVVSLLVAVVLGRGGDVGRLASLDVVGALGLQREPLAVVDVVVTRRHTRAGDAVVVAGVVVNQTERALRGVGVDVTLGAARVAGVAGATPDPLAVVDAATIDDNAKLQAPAPKDASVAPGARVPFVVVAAAPADGTPVSVSAHEIAGSP
jgi:hypothetical protein